MDDPDAPTPQPWVHWVIYKIPAAVTGLPEAMPADRRLTTPVQALQGLNSWNTVGYRGPAPPRGHGLHHYHFILYALDARLDLPAGMDNGSLRKAMEGHILAQTEWIGTYQR
jgi:Raf kinase inhibitor-like YbhB/YbcL family protein